MRAFDDNFVARPLQVLLDFVPILDLLAPGTRNALLWAVLVDVLLQLGKAELLRLRAAIRTHLHPRLATLLQMMVEDVVPEYLAAALGLVWTPKLQLIEHLLVQLVHLPRSRRELLPALIFLANT